LLASGKDAVATSILPETTGLETIPFSVIVSTCPDGVIADTVDWKELLLGTDPAEAVGLCDTRYAVPSPPTTGDPAMPFIMPKPPVFVMFMPPPIITEGVTLPIMPPPIAAPALLAKASKQVNINTKIVFFIMIHLSFFSSYQDANIL
jgi:hypothetical protein